MSSQGKLVYCISYLILKVREGACVCVMCYICMHVPLQWHGTMHTSTITLILINLLSHIKDKADVRKTIPFVCTLSHDNNI
jgi:hypothetical protein